MANAARYAYVQTRLQARHGARPDENEWRKLRSIGDMGNYLQVAQRGPLNLWVVGIAVNTPVHEIEFLLRQRFRAYIGELSRWLSNDWLPAILWVRRLLDLPALAHILSGQPAANWMLDDPELKPFIHVNQNLREDAFIESDCTVFLKAWKSQESLADAWFREWLSLSPSGGKNTRLESLWKRVSKKLDEQCEAPESSTEQSRELLEQELRALFRILAGHPENAFVHLGLIAMDLEKLRGDLLHRAIFQTSSGEEL
jgi:hypothetical protein